MGVGLVSVSSVWLGAVCRVSSSAAPHCGLLWWCLGGGLGLGGSCEGAGHAGSGWLGGGGGARVWACVFAFCSPRGLFLCLSLAPLFSLTCLVMSATGVLQVTSMVRALRVMSWVVAMLMWVLQVVCRLVAPLVLSLRRVLLGVLWAVVSSAVPMARVTHAMHWVTSVRAVRDALGMGGGELEGGLPLLQRAMVALVPQVVDRVMVLLVMPTRWFVCLSTRGVGAGPGRLPVRVVVAVGVSALGAWWAWLGAGARVGVYLVRVAGGLWAAGALLPCVWRLVLSGGAWQAFALRGWCGVWSAWVV